MPSAALRHHLLAWAFSLSVILGNVPALEAQGLPTIRIAPAETLLATVGDRMFLQVVVDNLPAPGGPSDPLGLAAFQFTFAFNPIIIHIVNPNEAFRTANIPPFAPLGGNPFCAIVRDVAVCPDPNWLLTSTGRAAVGRDEIDNPNGRVAIAYGTSGTPAPPTGSGVLALLEVVAQGNGCSSITLNDVILADNSEPPREFGKTTQNAEVCVAPACQLEVSPQMVDFGIVPVGMTAERTVDLKAADTGGDCTVSVALAAGAGAEWELPDGPVANETIATGDSLSIRMTYTPADLTLPQTTLEITSDDPNQPTIQRLNIRRNALYQSPTSLGPCCLTRQNQIACSCRQRRICSTQSRLRI